VTESGYILAILLEGGDMTPPVGNAAFWSFVATVAFIVQLILQKHYANQAAARAAQVKETAAVAAQKVEEVATVAAQKVEEVATVAAQKVEEVKQALEVRTAVTHGQLEDIKSTGDKIHTLVNNAMALVLKENASLARRIANMSGLAEDRLAADKAEQASREHDQKQSLLDTKDAKD
jgi:hypothetical protein